MVAPFSCAFRKTSGGEDGSMANGCRCVVVWPGSALCFQLVDCFVFVKAKVCKTWGVACCTQQLRTVQIKSDMYHPNLLGSPMSSLLECKAWRQETGLVGIWPAGSCSSWLDHSLRITLRTREQPHQHRGAGSEADTAGETKGETDPSTPSAAARGWN